MRRREKLTVVWCGSMFGGKTEEALVRVDIQGRILRREWKLIRPRTAVRECESEERLRTHGGRFVDCSSPSSIGEARLIVRSAIDRGTEIIWFDEPFLFPSPELVFALVVETLQAVPVIVSTLSKTSEGDPFPGIGDILAIADEIITPGRAVCLLSGCGRPASRSWYLGKSKGAIRVGGSEAYASVCVRCWNELVEGRSWEY